MVLRLVLRATAVVVLITSLQIGIGGADALSGAEGTAAVVDSEVRFLLAFWVGYGAVCWWVTGDLDARQRLVPFLAGMLALGAGLRVVSAIQYGSPGMTYLVATVVEAVLAVAMWWTPRTRVTTDRLG